MLPVSARRTMPTAAAVRMITTSRLAEGICVTPSDASPVELRQVHHRFHVVRARVRVAATDRAELGMANDAGLHDPRSGDLTLTDRDSVLLGPASDPSGRLAVQIARELLAVGHDDLLDPEGDGVEARAVPGLVLVAHEPSRVTLVIG